MNAKRILVIGLSCQLVFAVTLSMCVATSRLALAQFPRTLTAKSVYP